MTGDINPIPEDIKQWLEKISEKVSKGEPVHKLELQAYCAGVHLSSYHVKDKVYIVRACCQYGNVYVCQFELDGDNAKRKTIINLGTAVSTLKKLEMLFAGAMEQAMEQTSSGGESNYIL